MQRFHRTFAVAMLLAGASTVDAQVVEGVMSVTQAHMA
jgi:hypothetical protein